MNDDTYNPDEPLFLASRDLDETLSETERRRLDEALAESPDLRREADELRAVSRLVERWGQAPAELDWEHFATMASQSATVDEASLASVDRLVQRWGKAMPAYDAEAFVQNVLADAMRVSTPQRRPIGRGWLFKVGAPVAAAAAIGFALTARTWFGVSTEPVCRVAIGPSVMMHGIPDDPGERPRAWVSFSRMAPSGAESEREAAGRPFGGVFSSAAADSVALP